MTFRSSSCREGQRPTLPGDRPPAIGDIITTNYYGGGCQGFQVLEVFEVEHMPELMNFECESPAGQRRDRIWLYGYRMVWGRCLGALYLFHQAGHGAQCSEPPWNRIGFDEIAIIRRAEQPDLFGGLLGG